MACNSTIIPNKQRLEHNNLTTIRKEKLKEYIYLYFKKNHTLLNVYTRKEKKTLPYVYHVH